MNTWIDQQLLRIKETHVLLKKKSFKYHKIQISLAKKFQLTKVTSVSAFTYEVMNSAELLQHYLFKLLSLFLRIKAIEQSNLLSKIKNYLNNLLGKVSIQTFVNRSTRQSYKLLPEF